MNIVEEVRAALGYAPVQKVNPNTQTPVVQQTDQSALLSQASIPVTLIGLYKYTRSEANSKNLLQEDNDSNRPWASQIFGERCKEVIGHIASYAHVSNERAEKAMNDAARGAMTVARKNFNNHATAAQLSGFFKEYRNQILTYLPAQVQTGNLINDNTIDDRTNKMEGPISALMHTFEMLFSDSDANDSSKQ